MADQSHDHASKGQKRKRFENANPRHGSKGNRGNKGKNMGRAEWSRQRKGRREENDDIESKRQRIGAEGNHVPDANRVLPKPFSDAEIAAEERKPKYKVAVLIGYSGSGYKGMQISPTEKTIEGDLFTAFVAAGAVSKANANDPKKSSLVRCARTDKGVHAAGNVISLKLIIQEADIVEKINNHLPPQIRVWGYERTTGGFNCYQACDSRWYEYLIPSHAFLPPHPDSWLGQKLVELAKECEDEAGYSERQAEVASFWSEVDQNIIPSVMASLDEVTRGLLEKTIKGADWRNEAEVTEEEAILASDYIETEGQGNEGAADDKNDEVAQTAQSEDSTNAPSTDQTNPSKRTDQQKKKLERAIKDLKAAYITAKRAYRISSARKERIAAALTEFLGTKNFHNYTVLKTFKDPSAKRIIKSFVLDPEPKTINGTEWLSIKIHGQSFMMHQIRKMIGMIALVVRCGCPISRIAETFRDVNLSIPKAPGLGLLLERPVFSSYNEGAATKFDRPKIDFSKHETAMLEFKQREIYDRIHHEEAAGNHFHVFFSHIDQFQDSDFLYLSSKGVAAARPAAKTNKVPVGARRSRELKAVDSDDDEGEGDGEG